MVKKSLLFLLLFALMAPWAAKAQTTVTIGEGTATSNTNPIGTYYNYSITEQLYTADEIGTAGTISSISFYYMGIAANDLPITVYMANVDAADLSTGISLADADQVFSGTLPVTTTAGWVTINLDTPFAYDGTSSLLIGCIKDYLYYFNGQTWQGTATTATMARYTQNDYDAYTTSQVPSTAQANRPNIQMVITAGGGPTCPKPRNLQATLTQGNGSIATLSWTESGTATNWVLEYGTADDFTGATSVNVSGTPSKDLTGLVAETTYYARVKADCGGGDESDWSATCEFKPTNALTIEILGATASTSYYLPSYTNYDYSYTQQIYTATEMGGFDCILQSIAFKGNKAPVCTLDIYLANTEKSSFSGTSDYIAISEAELVFSGEVTFTANDWTTIVFDNEFEYEGGNLAVIVDDNSGNYSYGSTTWQAFSATGQSLYFYQDNNDVNPSAPSANSSNISDVKNQVMFDYTLPTPYKKPKNLTVSNLTNESATVAWEAPADATPTGYMYKYMAAGGTWTDLATATGLSANLTGLTANTDYTFQVQAIYSDGESDFVTTTFTTLCDAFPIPYTYGFEDAADMACWDIQGDAGIYTNQTDQEYARTGEKCFMFNYTETPPQYLISPELTGITTGLHLEFYYRQYESGEETFKVGYSTTDRNLSSFTWSDEMTATTTYQRFSANYLGQVKYVAIQHTSDDQYYLFLDDFTFEEVPSCLEPTNVQASNITTTGATITWTPGGEEEQWGIYVTTDINDVPDDATVPTVTPITTTSYDLTTLTPATIYYVYVQADCRGTSAWSSPVTFHTECEAMPLPFSYGFEDDALPVCWTTIITNTSYTGINIATSNAHGGTNSLDFHRGSSSGDLIAVLPEVDAAYDLTDYEFTFWVKGSNPVVIGIMTDPEDATTFVEQETITPTSAYAQHTVRFLDYTGNGQYLAIKNTHSTNAHTYIDDIEVNHLPSCLETSDPVVSNITAHTAQLDWTGYSPAYNVQYRTAAYMNGFSEAFNTSGVPSGWTQYTGLVDEVIAGTATLSSGSGWGTSTYGLGTYNLRLNIYGNSRKHWVVTPEFTLADGSAMSFDLALTAYNGNGAASGTCDDDRFAVLVFADNAWTILREWNNSGSHYVYTDIATTGETVSDIDISAYVGKTVKFAFYGESTVTGNGDNDLHIDNVTIGTPVAAGAWQTASFDTNTGVISGLAAETKYEAQVQGDCGSTDGTSVWSSLVSFTTTIACPAPTGLAYANLKSTQVDLSWTNGGADNWIVAYKQTADTDFTEVSVSSADVTLEGNTVTYTLTGLTEETAYTVKVSDNCEVSYPGDGTSEWTSTVSFTTMAACSVDNVTIDNIGHYTATVNWNGESASGFTVSYREAAGMGNSVLSEEFSTTSLPTGWAKSNTLLTDDVLNGTTTITTGSGNWYFGTSNGVFDSHARVNVYGTTCKHWLITKSIEVGRGNALSFDLALTAYSGTVAAPATTGTDDRFVVLVSNDNMATWTILREWNNSGSAYVYNNITCSATGENVMIDLSAYESQNVLIAFYCESTTSNADNNLHIDNVIVGETVTAGDWQTKDATESPANLTGLTVGTMYDVKVAPNCDASLESDIVTFSTVSGDVKYFITEGEWGTADNWEPTGAPTIDQTVTLFANTTIESGCVAEANNITQGTYTITIEDGGQLKHNNSGVTATVKKNIAAYPDATERSGYYLIANPLYTTISTTSTPAIASTGLLTGDYDLYNWSYSSNLEWANYKYSPFSLSSGMYGYLYANAADVELTFTGTLNASNSYKYRSANYSTSYEFGKWTLLGNPFVCNAYLVSASTGGTALAYYRMNAAGDGFEAVTGEPIAPMEGVFYEASTSGSVYMVRTAPVAMSNGNGNLNIVLAQNVTARGAKGSTDNAIIRFGEGNTLSKFSFNENNAKVYIPQDGRDYAVVNAGNVGEMPVNFKTSENGTYTLSFNSENVTFSYLHLIDNMTGADVDLLETPSYSFDARYTDYASRFRLVFATGSSIDGDSFGYVNGNGNLSIFGIEGEATVQVIDMLGHILSSETFSGSYEKQLNAAPGVYMIRLINGNDVKVQKIVVR